MMPIFTRNDEQYEFMARHHETVEVGVVMSNFWGMLRSSER